MNSERELLQKLRGHLAYKANMEPFKVFRDTELELLLKIKPKTIKELSTIKGFPENGARVTKYGGAIVDIFNRAAIIDDFEILDDGTAKTKLKVMSIV